MNSTEIQNNVENEESSSQDNENKYCFDVDYTFLENLSLSDPAIQSLFNELSLDSSNIEIDKIVNQNQDYFHHIFGNCACFKCICGLCRCNYANIKLTFKNAYKSIYGKEIGLSNSDQKTTTPQLFQTHYDTLSHLHRSMNKQIETPTTMHQTVYKEHPLQERFKRAPHNMKQNAFLATSTYQKNFLNWNDYDPRWQFRRPFHQSIFPESHFYGQTNYNSEYSRKKKDRNLNVDDVKDIQKQYFFYLSNFKVKLTSMNIQNKILHFTMNNLDNMIQTNNLIINCHLNQKLKLKYLIFRENSLIGIFSDLSFSILKSFQGKNDRECPAKEMQRLKKICNQRISNKWQAMLVDKLKKFKEQKQS